VRFPLLNKAGDGGVKEIEMARETEMVREMRGDGDTNVQLYIYNRFDCEFFGLRCPKGWTGTI
jgi:hypothetical protein